MIYNTETFEVSDVARFRDAMDSLRALLIEAGGTDIRLFRNVDEPNRVLASMWWPNAESCRAFARDHEEEFGGTVGPLIASHQPEDLWEPI
jgi:hypothetical protein